MFAHFESPICYTVSLEEKAIVSCLFQEYSHELKLKVLIRIWNQVIESIFYNDDNYITNPNILWTVSMFYELQNNHKACKLV